MKYVAILAALGFASAAVLAVASPQGAGPGRGPAFDRLKAADTNGDGMISREEAAALPKLAKRFDQLDANGDGQISADELRAHREQARADRWKKLDADGDGRISLAEAQANAPRLARHFAALDGNQDGFLTSDELKAAHQRHRGAQAK